jgi:hypothetical protein
VAESNVTFIFNKFNIYRTSTQSYPYYINENKPISHEITSWVREDNAVLPEVYISCVCVRQNSTKITAIDIRKFKRCTHLKYLQKTDFMYCFSYMNSYGSLLQMDVVFEHTNPTCTSGFHSSFSEQFLQLYPLNMFWKLIICVYWVSYDALSVFYMSREANRARNNSWVRYRCRITLGYCACYRHWNAFKSWGLLGCDFVNWCGRIPTFRWPLLPPSTPPWKPRIS